MSSPNGVNQFTQVFSTFWNARNERERKQLVLALAVAVLGLTYALLIDPAWNGRLQLQKSLPVLRQQSAELQLLAQDAAALAGAAVPPLIAVSKESIEASLASKGLKSQNVTLTGDLAKVQLSSVSFAGLLDWLDSTQKTARLSVIDANIVALDQPDKVNVALTLRQQKNEQRGE